jgi:hypothetical protein
MMRRQLIILTLLCCLALPAPAVALTGVRATAITNGSRYLAGLGPESPNFDSGGQTARQPPLQANLPPASEVSS